MDQSLMNVNELAVVCQSMKEMYKILQIEGSIYLPPLEQANHRFVAQIVAGEKQVKQVLLDFLVMLQEFRD